MISACSEYLEELSSFVDGELDQFKQTEIATHLSNCEGCRVEHDSYKSLKRIINESASKAQNVAPDLWSAIQGKLPSVCECIQEDLSAYLDGELIPSAKEGISTHLEQCSLCLKKFQELSKVTNLLSKGMVLPTAIDVDIWSSIKTRLSEDCMLIRSELSSFVDKEVATLRHREITTHLLDCEDCQNEFNRLSQVGDVLRNLYQPEIADSFDLWPDLKQRMQVIPIEQKLKNRPQRMRRLYAVAAAAIVGAVASVGAFLTYHSSSSQVQPVTAEAYLIDSSLGEPSDVAESVVYDH